MVSKGNNNWGRNFISSENNTGSGGGTRPGGGVPAIVRGY